MAIQFFCPSCGQPIEVDDEMANQTVTCPYCRSSAQTPGTSDPRVRSSAPAADSVETPPAATAPVVDATVFGQEAPVNKSVLGWVSLGCMVASGISFAIIAIVSMNIVQGIQVSPQMTPEELQQLTQKQMAQYPWVQPLSIVGSCVLPLIGLVCAIIAMVKRVQPRWPAIVSLVLAGGPILLVCGGMAVGAMQATQQGGP